MDKTVLYDYIDACEFIKDTEAEIKRLEKKKTVVKDVVKGSNPEWPYQPRYFSVEGTVESEEDSAAIRHEKYLRDIQKESAANLKLEVEEWMQKIPFRMQRIIEYKIFKELGWEEVAKLMGRKATGESVRQEFRRFMRDN